MIDEQFELAQARLAFIAYYVKADEREKAAFDILILSRAALNLGLIALRTESEGREGSERETTRMERTFLDACARVRRTSAFKRLSDVERRRFETELFRLS